MHGKSYQANQAKIKVKESAAPETAIELLKQMQQSKFDATVELHLHLGIDPKKGEQQVRSTVVLPHSFGRSKKVIAFVEPAKEAEAKEAGADIVASEETINEIAKSGAINFEVAVATPAMMPKLAKIAKILGPKGLMPNPKTETVSPQVKKMIEEIKRGKLNFKNDDTGNLHLAIGKISFDKEKLMANLNAVLQAIRKAKPASSKGTYIKNAVLKTTMSPGVKIAV